MSAANVYFLAGYPSGLIRSKEYDNVSDIFGTADSAEWNCRQYRALKFWSDPPGLHWPERYYIYVDPELAELGCRTSCVAFQRKLACPVRNLRWETLSAGCTHVYDPAPLCSPFDMPVRELCHHQGRRTGIHREHSIKDSGSYTLRAIRPQFDELVVQFCTGWDERVGFPVRRIVDENFNRPEQAFCLVEQLSHQARLREIALPRVRVRTHFASCSQYFVGGFGLLEVVEGQTR